MHSYGGIVGSEAIAEELGKKQRQLKGLKGGVTRLLHVRDSWYPSVHHL
jgi:hypothetical protein